MASSPLDLPLRRSVRAGDFYYLSGALGNAPGERAVSGDIGAQTQRTFANLKEVLEAEGLDIADVVSANVYLTDPAEFRGMNEAYRSHFALDPPARATIEAKLVLPGALVEISLVAAAKGVPRRAIRPKGWRDPAAPYCWGILAGDTLFVSGMLSRDPRTQESIPGDVKTQTRQALENIGGVLEAAGMDYRNVVLNRVFLAELDDFPAMNEVYRTFFPDAPPARATVRAGLMSPEFKVEIQALAVGSATRRVVAPESGSASSLPLSPAIQAGGRLFLSGALGRAPEGWEPDVRAQTRRTLEKLRATLQAAGMDGRNVVEATVYLTDPEAFEAMNAVYREMFPAAPPARATVIVGLMDRQALVEILMTAVQ
jgi:2-iminobutanoate/2-iminopropanoate deaminase